MARKYQNFISGTLGTGISSTDTALSSTGLSAMTAVSNPDVMAVILDPAGVNGAPEIIHVVAHSASATTATVLRGQEGTTARSHNSGVAWVHGITDTDVERLDTIEANGWVTEARLVDGAVAAAKIAANAVVAGKIAAGAINNANAFATGVVDAAAIGAGAVGTSELADGSVTSAKLAVLSTGRWASGSVSLTGGSFVTLTWTSESEDDLSSAAPSFTNWTAPAAGVYVFHATIVPAAGPGATGQIAAVVNSAIVHPLALANSSSQQGGTWTLVLGAGDTVYIAVLAASTITNNSGALRIVRLGLV